MAGEVPTTERAFLEAGHEEGILGMAVDTRIPERGVDLVRHLLQSGHYEQAAMACTIAFSAHEHRGGPTVGMIIAGPSIHLLKKMIAMDLELAALYAVAVTKIHTLAVHPDHRHRGIATHLLGGVLAVATKAGYRCAYGQYNLARDDQLRPFYSRLGFTIRRPGLPPDLTPALGSVADMVIGYPATDEVMFDRPLSSPTAPVK